MPRVWLLFTVMLAALAATGNAQELSIETRDTGSEQNPIFVSTVAHSAECNLSASCFGCDDSCDSIGSGRHGCCDFWTREHLMDGFWGLQPALAEHGILYDAQLTQFYQGVTNGGREQTFEYGGKLDQFFIFQGEKLGLWKGLEVVMHAETRFGQDVIAEAAGLDPVNANMLYPSLDNETAITGLQVMQTLNEDWAITFGKINTMDLFQTLYPQTGRGIDRFMNTSVFFPMTLAKTVPLAFNGAGLLKMHGKQIQGGVVVLDPRNIPTTSGLNDMFANGASVVGLWRIFTEMGGQPGSHMFVGTWASGDFTSLDGNSWVITPGQGIVAGQETGTWSLLYILEQQLWADHCNEKRNVGLMSQWSYADPETNPYEWVGNVSLQANGPFRGREADKMGVGWFYSGLSSDFKNLLSPPLEIRDLTGFEAYYNAAITPWFHLTADVQVVEPAERNNRNTAFLFGLRAKINL
jgi:porin